MSKEKVFIDTSALVAYLRQRDDCHQKAVTIWEKLRSSPVDFILTNYILAEFLTVIRQRVGVKAALEAGQLIKSSRLFIVIQASESLDERGWQIFKTLKSKNVSFVDCVSFALMKKLRIKKAFAFDQHFKKAGFFLLK